MTKRDGPIVIELDEAQAAEPAKAPPVPELGPQERPTGQAMQTMAALAGRRPSRLARLFWGLLGALFTIALSVAAWDFAWSLLARNTWLGTLSMGLLGAFLLVLLAIALREFVAFGRLAQLETLRRDAEAARAADDLGMARKVTKDLLRLYRSRPDTAWGRDRLAEHLGQELDSATLLAHAERSVIEPLDNAVRREIETASRQVATVTALVPVALADVIAALAANLRMIRRIAEIYGGRSRTLGAWRLTRTVVAHLVATGAVAVGDDLLGSVAGGSLLSRLSRRFGEGLVNGALTARVGVAAMEVCRPLPFQALERPSVGQIVGRALSGLFSRKGSAAP